MLDEAFYIELLDRLHPVQDLGRGDKRCLRGLRFACIVDEIMRRGKVGYRIGLHFFRLIRISFFFCASSGDVASMTVNNIATRLNANRSFIIIPPEKR